MIPCSLAASTIDRPLMTAWTIAPSLFAFRSLEGWLSSPAFTSGSGSGFSSHNSITPESQKRRSLTLFPANYPAAANERGGRIEPLLPMPDLANPEFPGVFHFARPLGNIN